MKARKGWEGFAWLLPVLFFGIFFFYPLLSIFRVSLSGSAETLFSASTWTLIGKRLFFTTWQAVLSTFLTFLVGLPGAYLFARFQFRGKGFLRALTTLPFILPTVVAAAAFNALLGPHGWINQGLMAILNTSVPPIHFLNTISAILAAHVFYNSSIIIRLVGNEWGRLDPQLSQAARTLGADRWKTLWSVTFPLLKPVFLAAGLLVFLFDFTSFGVILILGGFGFATLEVEIYTQAVQMLNLPVAGFISIIQMVSTLVITSIYTSSAGKINTPIKPRNSGNVHSPMGWLEKSLLTGIVLMLLLILVVPLLGLFVRSFMLPNNQTGTMIFSMGAYQALFQNPLSSFFYVPPIEAIRNSIIFALATTIISMIMGLLAAYAVYRPGRLTRLGDTIIMLPLGTSAVTLGLGFVVAFFQPPFNFQAAPWLIPVAHSLVAVPFVVRSILPALKMLPDNLRQSAAVLGATPIQVWLRVDLPILSRAVITGGIYAFTISIGEFGATSFLARPEYPTIPIAIYRYLSQPGVMNYGQALAMAAILLSVCAFGILVLERIRLPFGEI